MNIPEELTTALASVLKTTPTKSLVSRAETVSQRYRAEHGLNQSNQYSFLRSKEDVHAYIAYRMPATFAALYAALHAVQLRREDWRPHALLDVGAGPGTAMWAATTVWPEIAQVTLLERDQHMITCGKQVAAHTHSLAIQNARWQRADLTEAWSVGTYDLVIAGYMLGELPLSMHEAFIRRLWEATTDTLVLVEPGTPRGFSLIRSARDLLLAQGATILAPCPHNRACPMPANDWCHFAQRRTRTRVQRAVKGAEMSYEDEKFSYCALSKTSGTSIVGRVIRHPQKRSGHIHLELCTPAGLQHTIVTRSERDAYRKAHDLRWGDALE